MTQSRPLPTLKNLTDVNASSPSDGQSLTYDNASGKWIASTVTGSGSAYWLNPVLCSTTANVDLAGGGIANGTTHDGQTVSTGQRILVPFQSTGSQNGIYIVPASGAASRASDLPAAATADNVTVKVSRGTLYADKQWSQTANGCTVGTDSQTWQVDPIAFTGDSGSGGAGGGVPAPSSGDGSAGKALLATGAWGLITKLGTIASGVWNGTAIAAAYLTTMVGDSGSGGTKGAVPAPSTGDATKFLRGDATWATPAGGSGTLYNFLRNSTFDFGSTFADPTSGTNSVANDTYGMDGWNVLCQTGPTYNFQFTGTNARYCVRVQNANGSAKRVGISQILEASDSIQFRGQSVVFNARVQSDTASKNLRVAVLEWTGTADAVTSDVVNDWTSGTFTTSNFFKATSMTVVGTARITCTSTGTWYSGSVTGTVSSSCNNLIVMVFSEDTYTTNNGIYLECPGLYLGSTVPSWGSLPLPAEEARCRRFVNSLSGQQYINGFKTTGNQIQSQYIDLPVRMRATPTITATASPSWVTAGTSGNQAAFTGRVTAGYLSITGGLTAAAVAYSADRFIIYFSAATSFSGTAGEVGTIDIGSGLRYVLSAEL